MGRWKGCLETSRLACFATQRQILRMVLKIDRRLHIFDYTERCFHLFLRCIGPVFILVALSLIGFGVYVYFMYLCPLVWPRGWQGPIALCIITSAGIVILVNVLYNYAKAILVDPGRPPEFSKVLDDPEANSQVVGSRQCSRCKLAKPVRAHHCSVCKRCVLKMDHHCPWINNCVGVANYRYFLLFMLWLWILCIYGAAIFWPFFWDSLGPRRRGAMLILQPGRRYIVFVFSLAICIFIAISILGGFHTYLVLTNQTTIEFQTNLMDKREAKMKGELYQIPWNLGRRRNFQQVFGPVRIYQLLWLFSFWSPPPQCDGLSFPSPLAVKI